MLSVLVLLAALGLGAFWFALGPCAADAWQIFPPTRAIPSRVKCSITPRAATPAICLVLKLRVLISTLPAGGTPLKTPVGTLYPPNLTPDPETGLGNWTDLEFVNAMQRGIGKSGTISFRPFPYTSYAHMTREDVLDIRAYLATLPAVKNPAKTHDVALEPLSAAASACGSGSASTTAITRNDRGSVRGLEPWPLSRQRSRPLQ